MTQRTTGPAAEPSDGPDARRDDASEAPPDARADDSGWLDTFRSLPKPLRITTYLCVLLVLVLLVALAAGVALVRRPLPQVDGTIDLPGLSGPVTVQRDGHGIPQLYGDNLHDLTQAQGYVAAQDRFFEMDVRRHLTSGRLSEMFGAGQVETDAFLRTLDFRGVAQQEWDHQLGKTTKEYLQSYTDGVNAYLEDHSGAALSLEYAALPFSNGYKPRPWTPVDSVAWLKAMAWDLRGNMQDEIDRALMTSRLGPEQIADLYPAYPYSRNRPVVQEGQYNELTGTYESGGGESGSGTGDGTDPGAGIDPGTGTGTVDPGTGVEGASGAGTADGTAGSTDGTAGTAGTGSGLEGQLAGLQQVLQDLP